MAVPKYRLCNDCLAQGKETRVGTIDSPLVQITVGVFDEGLSYDARLPRWLWDLWTKFEELVVGRDGGVGDLAPVPIKHELCVDCLQARLQAPGALDFLAQKERVAEHRA